MAISVKQIYIYIYRYYMYIIYIILDISYIYIVYIYIYIHKIGKSSNSIVHGFHFANAFNDRAWPQARSLPLCFAQVLQHATHKTASNVVQRMLEHADVSRHLDLAKKWPRNHIFSTVYTRLLDLPPTYPNALSFFPNCQR